jgi:hypothetical protein
LVATKPSADADYTMGNKQAQMSCRTPVSWAKHAVAECTQPKIPS